MGGRPRKILRRKAKYGAGPGDGFRVSADNGLSYLQKSQELSALRRTRPNLPSGLRAARPVKTSRLSAAMLW